MLFHHPITLFSLGFIPYLVVLVLGPWFIRFLQSRYLGQYIREDGPQHHHQKAGTPTGGGVLIFMGLLTGLVIAFSLVGESVLTPALYWTLAVMFALGALGFVDDYLKITKKQNKGVSGYTKLAVQILAGGGIGYWLMTQYDLTTVRVFTEWTGWQIDLGVFFPVYTALVVTAASNAVNLTDGLDGLAGSTSVITLLAFFVIFSGATTLNPQYALPELAIFALVLLAATTGFLMFNWNPARLFMGDTGSLALGGAIGAMAVFGRLDAYLILMGIVFVGEALSVILQVASFKTTGKRIFKMSPLHHHFELCGWNEVTVVSVFSAVQLLGCLVVTVLALQ